MSWDHPVHSFSYPNGEPQTPTRTPSSAALDSFTTPKLESSFFDPRVTWDTADPYASSPEFLRSPQKFGIGTPSNALKMESDNLKGGRDTARRIRPVKPLPTVVEDGSRTVDSAKSAASMQTPPPTSASRRKIPDFDPVSSAGRGATPRMGSHLETPSRLLGSSPRMFGNLQSSSDLFQLASLDPAGSPFFPQQRLFCDQDEERLGNDMPLPGHERSNAHAERPSTHPSIHSHLPHLPTIDGAMDLPEFNSNGFGISSAPPTDAALFPVPFSTSPRLPVTKAEDPAMFLSSPARRFGGPQLTPERRPRGMRQPYYHQTEESKREELRRAQSGDRQAPGSLASFSEDDTEDDDFTPRGARPGLTRSATHTAITSSSHRPLSQAGGMMASTSGIRKSPSKGRASPAKTMRPAPLGRSSSVATGLPTRSQSVVLRIGRDGRAKAEMQPVEEGTTGLSDPLTGMELDGSATESEADPAEYSDYPILPRAQSSSGSRPPSKGSYTSTAGSSHSGRMSPWAGSSQAIASRSTYRGSPDASKRTPKRHSSLLHSDASFTRGSSISQSLPGEEEDSGDATHALRQVLKERGRGRPSTGGYGARLPRSSHTFTHLRSSPPPLTSDFDIHPRHSNASPTTLTDPDLATPSTDRNISNPSNGTRCICNSMDNGGHLMIQCESCSHWLHTKCVGFGRANLPSFYVCMFCDQTPSRQNRVRSGYPGGGPPSPLAHKSYRFR